MLERSIFQLMELFPRGTTDGQLLWRLRSSGLRNDASSVLAALTALSNRGEIRRVGDRWFAVDRATCGKAATPPVALPNLAPRVADEPLRAIRLSLSPLAAPGPDGTDGHAVRSLPAWQPLLRYYAATQRQDPRGSVERFADQHCVGWQIFDCAGAWWGDVRLSTPADQLPARLREALAMTGRTGVASVGWPIAVVRGADGTSFLPALLLPVTWELAPDTLSVTVQRVPPAINPAWMRQIRRRTAWTEDSLSKYLLGDEAEADLGTITPRLSHALASIGGSNLRPADLAPELAVAGEGLRNAAALFLPDETAFTRQTARDLETLADWPEPTRQRTALAALLEGGTLDAPDPITPVSPVALSETQRSAAASALGRRITAIQGPPGTGKSQTIVALIASAIVAGKSVIFVSRNHRALDEVEERVGRLLPGVPLVTRGRDAEGTRDSSLADALVAIAQCGTLGAEEQRRAKAARSSLLAEAATAARLRAEAAAREKLDLELSDLVERAARSDGPSPVSERARRSLAARLLAALGGLFRRRDREASLGDSPAFVDDRIRRLRRQLAETPPAAEPRDPEALPRLATVAAAALLPDPPTHEYLAYLKSELEFLPGGLKPHAIPAEDAPTILGLRPVWAISSLSVPGRIPLVPGLFDIAIFDEASQCDIASALPVLARVRRAIVVGDPQQLRFIPGLGRAQEHALMDSVGLPKQGRSAIAQSVNSLFDFTARRAGPGGTHLLTDQFRSAPDIVAYVSDAFYGGRLVARRSDEDLGGPRDYRPGLHWENVQGQTGREDGGNVNRAEAEAVVARLAALAADAGFDGSVGVISPFNAQVGLIRRRAEETLTAAERDRLDLHVGTVDRWQGGEADVIFFSLVTASGAPSTARTFLSRERRRINVAISRARAVAVVVGDLAWARGCGIAHIAELADRATRPPGWPQRGFDSLWERRMHEALRRRGIAAHPQYQVGSRSLDFAIFEGGAKLDLEVDGRAWHADASGGRKTADRMRDKELMAKGWTVRRFWVHELDADMEECLDIIERDLGRR